MLKALQQEQPVCSSDGNAVQHPHLVLLCKTGDALDLPQQKGHGQGEWFMVMHWYEWKVATVACSWAMPFLCSVWMLQRYTGIRSHLQCTAQTSPQVPVSFYAALPVVISPQESLAQRWVAAALFPQQFQSTQPEPGRCWRLTGRYAGKRSLRHRDLASAVQAPCWRLPVHPQAVQKS